MILPIVVPTAVAVSDVEGEYGRIVPICQANFLGRDNRDGAAPTGLGLSSGIGWRAL
jgi:hypothetical protein